MNPSGDGSVVEGVECCFDGAATVVAEDDDEWYVEDSDGVFDGAEDGVVEDMAECNCGDAHRVSTDVAGHVLPPLPQGCSVGVWILKEARPV